MDTISFLVLLGTGIWFWQDSVRTREIAVSYARRYCREMKYQLLDETVAVKTLKIGRNFLGNVAFHRRYDFELSANGYDRFNGNLFLIGQKLVLIQLNHPDGIIIQEMEN